MSGGVDVGLQVVDSGGRNEVVDLRRWTSTGEF